LRWQRRDRDTVGHHLLVDEASIQDLAIRGGLEPGLCAWVCLRMA